MDQDPDEPGAHGPGRVEATHALDGLQKGGLYEVFGHSWGALVGWGRDGDRHTDRITRDILGFVKR